MVDHGRAGPRAGFAQHEAGGGAAGGALVCQHAAQGLQRRLRRHVVRAFHCVHFMFMLGTRTLFAPL